MDKRLTWIAKYNEENNNEYKNFIFSGEYLAVYKPSHPKSRKDGYVYKVVRKAHSFRGGMDSTFIL